MAPEYPFTENELGQPLNQEDMINLSKAKAEGLRALDWFLTYSKAGEVFEKLRSDKNLYGAELLQRIEQPDASTVSLEFRWPVKTDRITSAHIWGEKTLKAKSYPASFNSILITLDRVQFNPPILDFAYLITIQGKKVELVQPDNLTPQMVKEAINNAFLNPRSEESQDKQR